MTDEAEFEEYIAAIAPDVFRVLNGRGFFKRLEAAVWTEGPEGPRACNGNFAKATAIMTGFDFSEDDQQDVFDVLRSRGGFCDCEIIPNAAEESLPRELYWKRRSAQARADPPSKLVDGEGSATDK